jgi:uncharacterized protein (DUF2147 family)
MIKKAGVLMLFLVASLSVLAQTNGDAIEGKWLNPSGEDQIWIYKVGNRYFGKLGWIKVPDENGHPKVDKNNPDPALRTRSDLNLELLKDFAFNGKTYEDGTIYDPNSGKTYSCKMTLVGNTLKIREITGKSSFSRTEVWTRVK